MLSLRWFACHIFIIRAVAMKFTCQPRGKLAVRLGYRFVLPTGHDLSKANCILNLSPVRWFDRQGVAVYIFKAHARSAQHGTPDVTARLAIQTWVVQSHSDARIQRRIEVLDAIGCEEENSLVVFKKAQEYARHCITTHVAV